jgi:hypothetical protein
MGWQFVAPFEISCPVTEISEGIALSLGMEFICNL